MAGPVAAQDGEDGEDEMSDADEAIVEDAMEELESAEPVEDTSEDDDPFDSVEEPDIEPELADVDVGEPVQEGSVEQQNRAARSASGSRGGSTGGSSASRSSDPFSGTESAGGMAGSAPSSSGSEFDPSGMGSAMDKADEPLEDIINDGAARLAVVGLDEQFYHNGKMRTKQDLNDEFREVFEEFRLGHFGSEVAEEYLFVEDDNVDPLMGLAASLTVCMVVVLTMRPDSDELGQKVRARVQGARASSDLGSGGETGEGD